MSDLSIADMSWETYTRTLMAKSRNLKAPLNANLELTPRCNFNCKMCYVHLSEKEALAIGKERTSADWINMGRQLYDAGVLELLLTGGEVFLRSDFREIYEAYNEMGFVLHIYSNGYLICGDTLEWLKKRPPMRLRITLYGASDETYENITGVKNAFSRVLHNIDLIREAGIPLSLSATIIQDNVGEKEAIEKIAKERDLQIIMTSGVMKAVRGAHSEAGNVRLNLADKLREKPEEFKIPGLFDVSSDPFAMCNSYGCGFWITWDGRLTVCSFIDKPCTFPFDVKFKQAWHELLEKLQIIKKPEPCGDCKYVRFCRSCPGQFSSETGFPDQTNDYICQAARARYEVYNNSIVK